MPFQNTTVSLYSLEQLSELLSEWRQRWCETVQLPVLLCRPLRRTSNSRNDSHLKKEVKKKKLWPSDMHMKMQTRSWKILSCGVSTAFFWLSLLLRFYAIDCHYSTNHLNEIKKNRWSHHVITCTGDLFDRKTWHTLLSSHQSESPSVGSGGAAVSSFMYVLHLVRMNLHV